MNLKSIGDKLSGFAQNLIQGYFALLMTLDLPKEAGESAQAAATSYEAKAAETEASTSRLTRELQPALQEANRIAEERIAAGKKVLQLKLGERWNPAYVEAGYKRNLEMPSSFKGQARLLTKMGAFFAKNPQWENKDLEVTAEVFMNAGKALDSALDAIKKHAANHRKLVKESKTAEALLRSRLRNLITEVGHVLSDDDVRWATLHIESPAEERAKREVRAEQRKRKSETAAEEATARKIEAAQRKVLAARIKSEKTRARAETATTVAASLQRDAVAAADEVARLESALLAMGGNLLTLEIPARGENVGLVAVAGAADSALVA